MASYDIPSSEQVFCNRCRKKVRKVITWVVRRQGMIMIDSMPYPIHHKLRVCVICFFQIQAVAKKTAEVIEIEKPEGKLLRFRRASA